MAILVLNLGYHAGVGIPYLHQLPQRKLRRLRDIIKLSHTGPGFLERTNRRDVSRRSYGPIWGPAHLGLPDPY